MQEFWDHRGFHQNFKENSERVNSKLQGQCPCKHLCDRVRHRALRMTLKPCWRPWRGNESLQGVNPAAGGCRQWAEPTWRSVHLGCNQKDIVVGQPKGVYIPPKCIPAARHGDLWCNICPVGFSSSFGLIHYYFPFYSFWNTNVYSVSALPLYLRSIDVYFYRGLQLYLSWVSKEAVLRQFWGFNECSLHSKMDMSLCGWVTECHS